MVAAVKFFSRNIFGIALLVGGIIIGASLIGTVESLRLSLFPQTGAFTRSEATIVNGIKGIGQLVTVTADIELPDIQVEIHRGIFNLGYYSANHIATGALEAGIDFAAIDEDNIRYENGVYKLSLPAPVITSCRIEYIDQNQYSITLFSADWDMVRQIAQAEALTLFVEKMTEQGILERAAEETALQLGEFVREITGKPTQVDFAPQAGEPALPDSCQPIAPPGWEKNEKGAWKRAVDGMGSW